MVKLALCSLYRLQQSAADIQFDFSISIVNGKVYTLASPFSRRYSKVTVVTLPRLHAIICQSVRPDWLANQSGVSDLLVFFCLLQYIPLLCSWVLQHWCDVIRAVTAARQQLAKTSTQRVIDLLSNVLRGVVLRNDCLCRDL